MAELSGAPVVEVDDFLSWEGLDGWWPRLEAELLEPLFEGRDARYQVRDWQGDFEGTSLVRLEDAAPGRRSCCSRASARPGLR